MNKLVKYLALILLQVVVIHQNIAQKSIKRREVKNIVKNLSSDKMLGRSALGEGGKITANYISNYFEEIGLHKFKNLENYFQTFNLYQFTNTKITAELNGHKIPENEMFFISKQTKIEWSNNPKVEQLQITTDENFREAFQKVMSLDQDLIVTVSANHVDIFNKYRQYLSQSQQNLKINEGRTKVFILSNPITVNEFSIKLNQNTTIYEISNVVGMIPGKSKADEFVIFSAHYDHLGVLKPEELDSIANGADDDASGTTAIMALAKYYQKIGGAERSLIFVAFTAEEEGGYGSQYFANNVNTEATKAMFNIEMIGKISKFGPKTAFITGFEESTFGKLLQKNLQGSPYQYYPDPYLKQNLFYRSDNAALAKLGVPAHSISTDQIDIDPYYHTVKDELKTLDIKNLTYIIRSIAISARSIVSGMDTPSRVEIETSSM